MIRVVVLVGFSFVNCEGICELGRVLVFIFGFGLFRKIYRGCGLI